MLRLFLKLKSYYLARPNFFVSGSWPPISTNISSSCPSIADQNFFPASSICTPIFASSKAAKSGRLQKSPAFLWLKANAHRWGFTPYKREPWHWELKVPYESWRTGEEFVQDGNYAVRVIETKK